MASSDEARHRALADAGARVADRFVIRRLIAVGAMGAVYEALDEKSDRVVAIKLLHSEYVADRDLRRRFRREASILETLDHPCIVRIFELGTDANDRSYIAMELLKGETLRERMDRKKVSGVVELLPIVRGICEGLQVAHDQGIVHGDLTPNNVFLGEHRPGHPQPVKLVDFGLSKIFGLERLTRTGEVIGTPHYMAPELLTGKGAVDGRIDTYALGIILYEALAGTQPFDERNPGKLVFSIVMTKSRPLRLHRPDISAVLENVVHRAMAPNIDDRFASAKDLAQAFAEAVRSEQAHKP